MIEGDRDATLRQGDLLEMNIKADAVIMNPPFKMGRDIKHILHAFENLAPGGLLISLCYNGVKQNKQLKPLADTWEVLPAGSFKAEGTRAEIVLLTLTKGRK
jgi:16S rRNA G1207 methylase RsmC